MAEVRRRRRALVAASTLALTLALTACSGGQPGVIEGGQETADGWAAASTILQDTSGANYAITEDADAAVTLVFFGYTNCPDICGMVMGNLASALTRLDDDQRKDVEVVFVTTDPARDTEAALRTYLDRYDPSFIGLRGKMNQVSEVGDSFHIAIEQGEKLPTGGYDVGHSDQVFFVDEDDSIPLYWSRDTSPATFASDIATLLKADS